MRYVTGIFSTWDDATRAADMLHARGFSANDVNVLARESDARVVPTTAGEQPGVGRAIGGVVGGAAGAAVGVQVLAAAITGLVPGVGPVLVVGAFAGVLAGLGGAAAGQAIENRLTEGLPKDEMLLYQEALRRGHSVVFVQAHDAEQEDTARAVLRESGAESLDAAREAWWVGLRDAEATAYSPGDPTVFARDEVPYRRGFERALQLGGQPWAEAGTHCREIDPDMWEHAAYRRGFERGREYHRQRPA